MKKRLLNLSAIIIGVFMCLGFNKVQASNTTFNVQNLTRENLRTLSESNALQSGSDIVPIMLGVSESGYITNYDEERDTGGYRYWSIKDSNNVYKDLYCVNLSRGFGEPDGASVNENNTKRYVTQYDKDNSSFGTYTGLSDTQKDKILWILNHSVTSNDISSVLKAASSKVEQATWRSYIQQDMINNNDSRTALTFDDIKIIQQAAIWHYSNNDSVFEGDVLVGISDSSTKRQISSQGIVIEIDTDTYIGTLTSGFIKQKKIKAVYQYFIDGADSATSDTEVNHTLNLTTTNSVSENGEYFVAGPFALENENVDITDLTVELGDEILSSSEYIITNSESSTTSTTDYSNFYVKVKKSKVTSSSTIKVTINGKYNIRTFTFLTDENDPTNTQPVVLIEDEKEPISTSDSVDIILEEEEPAKPDLALRKFITKIGEKPYDREPNIGAWTLDNGTTVTKTHSKDALTVETGNLVTYKIRIYNEGNVNGKATLVTDYLPSGLELASNNQINNDNGWQKKETRNGYTAVTTDHLKNTTIEAYSGRGIPKFVDLEIVCKVTAEAGDSIKNLKNIAEITDAEYEKGTSDIDSTPRNVNNISSTYDQNPVTGKGEEDDDDFEWLVMGARKPEFDLALRKFITAINNEELKNIDGTYTRAPEVDETRLRNGTATTATYKHTKQPISVQKGDIVTYTIRVYNESKELGGYVNEIADHLPDYLLPIINGVDGIDATKYAEEIQYNLDREWEITSGSNTVKTRVTAKDKSGVLYNTDDNRKDREDVLFIEPYENREILDYIDVQIKCLVKDDTNLTAGTYLTNIAEIVDAEDINGEHSDGKDSALDGLLNGNKTDTSDLFDYRNTEALASDNNSYIAGQEDDDDFEKLIIESFDLALRKYITAIGENELKNEDGVYIRKPKVDTTTLGLDGVTTATYEHPKNALNVKKGDIITYTLRVYNEGTLSGYANQIIDYLPEGLEFIKDSSVNIANGWKMLDKDGNETLDPSQAVKIVTDSKSESNALPIDGGSKADNNIILAFHKETMTEPDSIAVQVQLIVTADPKEYAGEIITNWAEIGEDSNNDIDSTPGNGLEYKDEDDIDYEPVKLVYFDLALKKFITNANGTDYNNRAPEVDTSKLGTLDENGKKITDFTYNQTKDPVVVETGSTVVYTIRVYNEGTVSGYALGITDNIPEGLEFLPENETNNEYKWKMLDEEGNITEDVTKAKKITTTYLENELLDAYQKENGAEVISFKDVKVAFKVIEPNTSDRLVINTAEISKASDEDIDSTPGNEDVNEDDIDKEYLKVKYFDLVLKKWVTATRVTYNGKTKTTKTEFDENSTEMAKVDLVSSRLKKTTVKFVYNIKVINEGEVAGYATEVEDYIPKGLKFVAADNPKWKLVKDNVAVTDQLKDTLLEPGQSAIVEIVLTWKNSSSNMGVKTNWAEIKEDSGDDVDSTPDNNNKLEDDIDSAKVILSIKTGSVRTYILLTLISITILAGGIFTIKKYVINK